MSVVPSCVGRENSRPAEAAITARSAVGLPRRHVRPASIRPSSGRFVRRAAAAARRPRCGHAPTGRKDQMGARWAPPSGSLHRPEPELGGETRLTSVSTEARPVRFFLNCKRADPEWSLQEFFMRGCFL